MRWVDMKKVDLMGEEVSEGDYIAFPDGNVTLKFGIIVKINPKTIKVLWVGSRYVKQVPYGNFVKLDQNQSLIKAMSIQ